MQQTPQQRFDHYLTYPEDPQRENPYPLFAQVRHQCPVYFHEASGGYFLFSHADVQNVLQHESGVAGVRESIVARLEKGSALSRIYSHLIFFADQPLHSALRESWNPAFHKVMKGIKSSSIQQSSDTLFRKVKAEVQAHGEVDFVSTYASYFPVTVISELLGIPAELHVTLRLWTLQILASLDPMSCTPQQWQEAYEASANFFDFFEHFRKEHQPQKDRPDLTTAILESAALRGVEGDALITLLITLFIASHDNVANTLANLMFAWIQFPEQFEQLRREQILLSNLVDELLRYDTSFQMTFRTLSAPLVCSNGSVLPQGAFVTCVLGSANRDEAIFADPDRFDLRRPNSRLQLAFGAHGSVRSCLGAPFAEMLIRCSCDSMLNGIIGAPILRGCERKHSSTYHAFSSLLVSFTPGIVKGRTAVGLMEGERPSSQG